MRPTLAHDFSVNYEPAFRREGSTFTSRDFRDRWRRSSQQRFIRVEDYGHAESFRVLGRGELQLAI